MSHADYLRGFCRAASQQGVWCDEVALSKQAGYSLTDADLSRTIRSFNPQLPTIRKPNLDRQSFAAKYPRITKPEINQTDPIDHPRISHPTILYPETKHPVIKHPEINHPELNDPPEIKSPGEIKPPTIPYPKPVRTQQLPPRSNIDHSQSALLNRRSEETQLTG